MENHKNVENRPNFTEFLTLLLEIEENLKKLKNFAKVYPPLLKGGEKFRKSLVKRLKKRIKKCLM